MRNQIRFLTTTVTNHNTEIARLHELMSRHDETIHDIHSTQVARMHSLCSGIETRIKSIEDSGPTRRWYNWQTG